MNRKLVFFDIDGTLVGGSIKEPTIKTQIIIKRMIELGHIPILATGRPLCMLEAKIKDLGFESFVSSAGSYVLLNGKVLLDQPIPAPIIQKAIDLAVANKIDIFTENPNEIYIHPEQEKQMHTFLVDRKKIDPTNVITTTNFLDKRTYKLSIRWHSKEAFTIFYNEFKKQFNFAIFNDSTCFGSADVMYLNSSKAQGIRAVLDTLQIDAKDVYAIGDGENDIEMFELVGNGIAMGNAVDKLKALATMVTDSVDDDGVYNAFVAMDWMK